MTKYRFQNHRFDDRTLELRRGDERVQAQPRVLGLLAYLLNNRDRIVTKDELVDQLWQGRTVSDDAVNKRIALLRKALADNDKASRLIRTIYGKGVRFSDEVVVEEEKAGLRPSRASALPEGERSPGARRGSPPRLAVMPFRLVTITGRHAAMAEAIPDDITSSLVKLKSLPVIARGSAYRYAGEANPIAAVLDQLAVSYVVTGRVEIDGERMSIYAELVSTDEETLVWSDSYRGNIRDVHEIRETIVGQIVSSVEMAIPREEASRARLKMPSSLDAWEAYHLGQSASVESLNPDFRRGEIYFRRALEIDPDFARAHASLAYANFNFFSAQSRREESRIAMLASAEKALALAPQDPVAQMTYGAMNGSIGDYVTAETHMRRCIELAPNYARGHASMGGILAAQGKIPQSLEEIGQAISLSPRDPHMPTWLAIRLVGNTMMGKMDEVRAISADLADAAVNQIVPLGWAMTGYSLAGDRTAAEHTAERLRSLMPKVPAAKVPGVYDGIPAPLRAMLEKSFRDYALVE